MGYFASQFILIKSYFEMDEIEGGQDLVFHYNS